MKILLSIFCLVLLVSCSNEVPSDKLVERNGITYEVNSQTPFTGSKVSYHDNSQLRQKGNYINGKEDGLHESYHENGQLRSKWNYIDGKVEDGLRESYHDNGQLWSKENLKDGKLEGFYEEYYYQNSQLKSRNNLKDGKLDGLWERYHEDSSVFWKLCYENGEEVDMSYCEK